MLNERDRGVGPMLLRRMQWLLMRFVRFRSFPADASGLNLDPRLPVVYALQIRQFSALLVLDQAVRQMGLPPALAPLRREAADGSARIDERSRFFFLTRRGQPSPLQRDPYRYSDRLLRLVQAVAQSRAGPNTPPDATDAAKDAGPADSLDAPPDVQPDVQPDGRPDVQLDVQLVPVSIFWGRAPIHQDSVLKTLFADNWVTPGFFSQGLRLLIHGRQTVLKFGAPISVRAALAGDGPGDVEARALRRIARLLRAEYKRERELAVGPNLSHRQTVVNHVIASPAVQQAIDEATTRAAADPADAAAATRAATEPEGGARDAIELRARKIAVEIAADYSYPFIRLCDRALGALWNRIYDGVEVHGFDEIAKVGAGAEIVYLPCHRSHVDYLLLSYMIYHRGLQPPHIAAGENLNLPLIGRLLRRGGAFFLRRSFKGDALYGQVFREYLHTIIERGFPIEFFIEGGRSRTGRLLAPKTGMLAMAVHSWRRNPARPIVFIPVYIGYERLIEGETYFAELSGQPKKRETLLGFIGSLRALRQHFGKVQVSIGEPVRIDAFFDASRAMDDAADTRRATDAVDAAESAVAAEPAQAADAAESADAVDARSVTRLARTINARINAAVVVNPANLLALALTSRARSALDEGELAQLIECLQALLRAAPYGPRQQISAASGRELIDYGLRHGLVGRIAHPMGDIIEAGERQARLLGYFRNNVCHAFAVPSLIAALIARNDAIERADLSRILAHLYPFLRADWFLWREPRELPEHEELTLAALRDLRLVRQDGTRLRAPPPFEPESALLHQLAAILQQPLERYYLVITTLVRLGSGRLGARQLEDLCVSLAQRIAWLQPARSAEFSERGAFRSLIATMIEGGQATESGGLLEVSPQLQAAADDAHRLLDPDTRIALSRVAALSPDDIRKLERAVDGAG